MRVPAVRWVAGGAAAASVALIAAALTLAYADRHLVPADMARWNFSDVFGDVVNLAVPVVGLVLASRRPANRIGWLFLAGGLVVGLASFSPEYALRALVAAPGSWPAGRAFAWLASWIWVGSFGVLAFVFLLFPTGRLRSRRWLPAGWFAGGVFTLAAAVMIVYATRFWSRPVSLYEPDTPVLTALGFLMTAALVVSVVALVVRFVRSAGEERLQLKWFAAAASVVVATFVAAALTDSAVVSVLQSLAFLCLWVAIGVAVLKYRLYDIDIVISKAVLFGSLAIFITAVYAGLVIGVGTLAGGRDSPLLAALAAAVVAVAFQPARQWAGRLANRVVYGRRATPYQVLSDFARRIGGTYAAGDVLPQMARTVAAGTGAEQVVVWLRVGGELRPGASSDGSSHPDALPVDGHELPRLPDADMSVPVVHQGELLGAISARMPKDEPLRPAGQQLVADVASQAGLVLANAGLIEDLRSSRQRLVAAQDEARRRLERNLHDGAQQDLVAVAIKARLGATVEDLLQAKELFGELQAETASALENLRDLARGIYPPLLADLGLAAALNAQVSKCPVPVTVEAGGIGRFGQDTEAAVYFCCLEALQNTAKYAHATQARICLQARNGSLRFAVSDDGTGYDARHVPMGSGLRNMADRLAALGGRLDVQSAPSHGTTVTGHLPTAVPSAALTA
ncbi:MAG TPA: ATP-binding protein [Streptosporangiaceae bacterium]|nr:ATP-binding protein [Streptosporangiaceae bacterium]